MKIIFLATPSIAINTLYALKENFDLLAVVTQPDTPKGRSKKLISSDIALVCEKENIPVLKPNIINNKLIEQLTNLNADLFITFAYGVILPKSFFSISKLGGINIHPSLLPKYRGASPIQTALLNGDTVSGITIQKMALKVDSGDILLQHKFNISDKDDAITIEQKVSEISSILIIKLLNNFNYYLKNTTSQEEKNATFCKMYKKNDGLINWNNNTLNIINKIRSFVAWPVAYSFIDKERINIYKATINKELNFDNFTNRINGEIILCDNKKGLVVKANDGLINLEILQRQGKKKLECKDFVNGNKSILTNKFSSFY